jgi:Na+/H+ antiporter NhaC
MQTGYLVIVPPLLVLFLAFITHRVISSLIVGILSATLIFHDFSIIPALKTAGSRFLETIEIKNLLSWKAFLGSSLLFIFLFLLILGIIIVLIEKTGGTKAYGDFIGKKSRDARAAETSTLGLSLLFFIDDYLNVATVGSSMPSVTDRFKIPRIKIAFFVNAFAASLPILVPFSSWGAYILMQLDHSGVAAKAVSDTYIISSPFSFFIKMIPFAFYSLIIVATTFFIVRRKISFGPMKRHEKIAQKAQLKKEKIARKKSNNSMIDFLFPITFLVLSVFIFLIVTNYSSSPALFLGGSTTLLVILPYFLLRKKVRFNQLGSISLEGAKSMLPTLVVISMALTFGEILTGDLLTGKFIATKLLTAINISFLPILFFVVTTLVALGIGSAWGAMLLIIPIAIPMITSLHAGSAPFVLSAVPIALPTIGAVLAGSVAGINLSPIADIVVMASTVTKCHHIDHVKAQQVYILPVFIASCVAFLCAGFLINLPLMLNALISLTIGICVSFSLMLGAQFFNLGAKF